MFCKNCGMQVEDDWQVCPACGMKLQETEDNNNSMPVKQASDVQKKKPLHKKWWFLVLMVIVLFFAFIMMIPSSDDSETTEKQESNLNDMDMESLIGKSEEEIKELGFEKNEDFLGYVILDGAVEITCTEGKVDMIIIQGEGEEIPAFHGVKMGMEESEAYSKLKEDYPEEIENVDGKMFINTETKGSVNCKTTEGKISCIQYMALSDDLLDDYTATTEEATSTEYIFPDSDKKYLSEDEIRNVEAEKLAIGRNEIFARHGYIFKSEELKKHFESTSWYEGTIPADDFNSDSVFNEFEKKNVELIKQIEDEINGFSFSGRKGSYVCTNPEYSDLTGRIEILGINDDSFEFVLDVLNPDYEYDILSGTAIITGDNKAEFSGRGIKLIFSWSDDSTFYIEQSGIYEGQDADIIDITTDNACYVWDLEFN